jgi:hypothetical protein
MPLFSRAAPPRRDQQNADRKAANSEEDKVTIVVGE